MSDDGEMSDEELDALISDLESRSGESVEPSSGGAPEEEIDEFLQELEEEESGGTEGGETAVADAPEEDVGPDLSELEGADELPVEGSAAGAPDTSEDESGASEEAEASRGGAESKESKEAAASDAGSSESAVWKYTWLGFKWTGFIVPVVALMWLLGAYLGHWVSAGWLILVMTALAVFGIPKLAYDAAGGRGRYRWWLAGFALLAVVGLTAPLAGPAGDALAAYGHWPGAVLTEVFGTDLGLGAAFGQLGEALGSLFSPGIAESATQVDLGSIPSE